eukprot:SM000068S20635  [mRNA]  locus=s68:491559:492570:- [translate_table: standard]
MTMSRTIKLYKLPTAPAIPGLRPMERRDVSSVCRLLSSYLSQFVVAPSFTEADIEHLLLPVESVVDCWVVDNPSSQAITDFFSFYTLNSSIIGNDSHSTLRAAYSYYNVATSMKLKDLMQEALIVAMQKQYDVFNALDIMHNQEFLKALKFGPGDGHLHYYLYNYRLSQTLSPSELGLVLL